MWLRWKNLTRENIVDRAMVMIFAILIMGACSVVWKIGVATGARLEAGTIIFGACLTYFLLIKLAMLSWEPTPMAPTEDVESMARENKQMMKDGHCSCRDIPTDIGQ